MKNVFNRNTIACLQKPKLIFILTLKEAKQISACRRISGFKSLTCSNQILKPPEFLLPSDIARIKISFSVHKRPMAFLRKTFFTFCSNHLTRFSCLPLLSLSSKLSTWISSYVTKQIKTFENMPIQISSICSEQNSWMSSLIKRSWAKN